jgi:hypothetical protein
MILHVFVLIGVFLLSGEPNQPSQVETLAGSYNTLEACQAAAKDTADHLSKDKPEELQAVTLGCLPVDLKVGPDPHAVPAEDQ